MSLDQGVGGRYSWVGDAVRLLAKVISQYHVEDMLEFKRLARGRRGQKRLWVSKVVRRARTKAGRKGRGSRCSSETNSPQLPE